MRQGNTRLYFFYQQWRPRSHFSILITYDDKVSDDASNISYTFQEPQDLLEKIKSQQNDFELQAFDIIKIAR